MRCVESAYTSSVLALSASGLGSEFIGATALSERAGRPPATCACVGVCDVCGSGVGGEQTCFLLFLFLGGKGGGASIPGM